MLFVNILISSTGRRVNRYDAWRRIQGRNENIKSTQHENNEIDIESITRMPWLA